MSRRDSALAARPSCTNPLPAALPSVASSQLATLAACSATISRTWLVAGDDSDGHGVAYGRASGVELEWSRASEKRKHSRQAALVRCTHRDDSTPAAPVARLTRPLLHSASRVRQQRGREAHRSSRPGGRHNNH